MKPSRRELRWLLASYLLWAGLAADIGTTSVASSNFTDHWSHYGRSYLFFTHGFDVYRYPTSHFCTALSLPAKRSLPSADGCDWCLAEGTTAQRPLCINWQYTRASYPPGLFLYSLPEVLLFAATPLSFRAINLFSILKFLAVAHLLMWLFFRIVIAPPEAAPSPERASRWLRLALLSFVWLEIGKWTLGGFYDPISVCALLLGIWWLSQNRGIDSILALSSALFLHYRALWYLPLFFVAAWTIVKRREWKAGGAAPYVKLAAAGVMLGPALYGFALMYPGLAQLPTANPARLLAWASPIPWNLLLPLAPVALYLASTRQWVLLACAAWQLFTVARTPQVQWWHVLFLLPMFALARLEKKGVALAAAAVLYVTEAVVIFGNALPLPGWQLGELVHRWKPFW
jgi:hypothetical protein